MVNRQNILMLVSIGEHFTCHSNVQTHRAANVAVDSIFGSEFHCTRIVLCNVECKDKEKLWF